MQVYHGETVAVNPQTGKAYYLNSPDSDAAGYPGPVDLENAEAWRDKSGIKTHFNRFFPISNRNPVPNPENINNDYPVITDTTGEPTAATGNANNQGYNAVKGIPSSKEITGYAEAQPWSVTTKIWARMVSNTYMPVYRYIQTAAEGTFYGQDARVRATNEMTSKTNQLMNSIKDKLDKYHDTPKDQVPNHWIRITFHWSHHPGTKVVSSGTKNDSFAKNKTAGPGTHSVVLPGLGTPPRHVSGSHQDANGNTVYDYADDYPVIEKVEYKSYLVNGIWMSVDGKKFNADISKRKTVATVDAGVVITNDLYNDFVGKLVTLTDSDNTEYSMFVGVPGNRRKDLGDKKKNGIENIAKSFDLTGIVTSEEEISEVVVSTNLVSESGNRVADNTEISTVSSDDLYRNTLSSNEISSNAISVNNASVDILSYDSMESNSDTAEEGQSEEAESARDSVPDTTDAPIEPVDSGHEDNAV